MKTIWLQGVMLIGLSLWGGVTLSQDAANLINSTSHASTQTSYFSTITAATIIATLASTINSTIAAVIIGGGLGALSRYTVSRGVSNIVPGNFHGTMVVNIIGSLAFGTVTGRVTRNGGWITDTAWLDLMTTGFLGGFTTFSTFANDTVHIARHQGILFSSLYTGFSVTVAVAAILVGEFIGTTILP